MGRDRTKIAGVRPWRKTAPQFRQRRKQIARRIRIRRQELQISMTDAAAIIGVHRITWYNWEREEASIAAELIPQVAKILQTSVSDLMGAP